MVPSLIFFFKESTIVAKQTIYFSGVDAQHKNWISERMINTVTSQ